MSSNPGCNIKCFPHPFKWKSDRLLTQNGLVFVITSNTVEQITQHIQKKFLSPFFLSPFFSFFSYLLVLSFPSAERWYKIVDLVTVDPVTSYDHKAINSARLLRFKPEVIWYCWEDNATVLGSERRNSCSFCSNLSHYYYCYYSLSFFRWVLRRADTV